MNERAKAAAAYLSGVDADGLDPSRLSGSASSRPAPSRRLWRKPRCKFTDTVLTFARHAQTGRVHYSRVASDILYNLVKPEPADVLAKLASAKDVGEALDSYNPPQPGYKALKAKLAEARNAPPTAAKPSEPKARCKYGKAKKGKCDALA